MRLIVHLQAEQLHVSEKMRDVMRQMSVIDQTGLTIQSEINNLRREIQGKLLISDK